MSSDLWMWLSYSLKMLHCVESPVITLCVSDVLANIWFWVCFFVLLNYLLLEERVRFLNILDPFLLTSLEFIWYSELFQLVNGILCFQPTKLIWALPPQLACLQLALCDALSSVLHHEDGFIPALPLATVASVLEASFAIVATHRISWAAAAAAEGGGWKEGSF